MKIVIVSGKGGTGKTTITASYSVLSRDNTVKVDCDVDASNLHLMFDSKVIYKEDFSGAKLIHIDRSKCIECHKCVEVCRFGALSYDKILRVNELKCEGCGACRFVCLTSALSLKKEITGEVMLEKTMVGLLSRAEMISGQEGSGKLVSEVRQQADNLGQYDQLLDGSPGIGCSVIASITGTDYAIVVTEPTQSGLADMKRVLKLIEHFEAKPFVIINKYDLNTDITVEIERLCLELKIEIIGKIPFDSQVKEAINIGVPIVSFKNSTAAVAIRNSYNLLKERIGV